MPWYIPVLVTLMFLSFILRLMETGWVRRSYQEAMVRLRRAPRGLVVIFSMLLVWAIAYGGSKPSGQSATPPALPQNEVTQLPADDDLVVYPEGQAAMQLEVPEQADATPDNAASWSTGSAASPSAPDTLLDGNSNLTRLDFPEANFEAPAGLPRWPFDASTSNAIVGMAASTQSPIPDVMLATGLALHRVTTNQTLLADKGGSSIHDWTRHGADNRAVWVDTPFPVLIGAGSYTRVGILSNGRLAFGYGTYHRRTAAGLPIDTPYPVVTVAPLWGPFALLPTTSRIWARPEGTNAFVVAWEAMLLDGNESAPATAQCVIGRDGTFRFLYGPQPDGAGGLTTVGAQNQGHGWCYSNSHSNRVQEAMAVSLRPAALDGWADADSDGDSISNYEEFMLGTDPALADGDTDGPSDRWEIEHGFDPTVAQLADPDPDSDGDLIPDGWEDWMESDPEDPNSGRWNCIDDDGDGFVAWYETLAFYTSDADANSPGPVDEDHVDVTAIVDSTRPCVLSLTGPDQDVDIPWVPGVSPNSMRLRLTRGKQYQVVLSRAPATNFGLSTNGFWWANVRFEAPPEFWGLNGPETVADGVLAYNAHTVHIETPFRHGYDLWLYPGKTSSPFFDLAALKLAIDGPLMFCHNTTEGEIALTPDSLVTGPVDWAGLPPLTPVQANPLVFDPSAVTPGVHTVVAVAAGNPWVWAERQVEIHSLAFAESVIWLSAAETNAYTIALAPGSFPATGLDVWSDPPGLTSLTVTPSEIEPGSYTVYAWGACGGAETQVHVVQVEFVCPDVYSPNNLPYCGTVGDRKWVTATFPPPIQEQYFFSARILGVGASPAALFYRRGASGEIPLPWSGDPSPIEFVDGDLNLQISLLDSDQTAPQMRVADGALAIEGVQQNDKLIIRLPSSQVCDQVGVVKGVSWNDIVRNGGVSLSPLHDELLPPVRQRICSMVAFCVDSRTNRSQRAQIGQDWYPDTSMSTHPGYPNFSNEHALLAVHDMPSARGIGFVPWDFEHFHVALEAPSLPDELAARKNDLLSIWQQPSNSAAEIVQGTASALGSLLNSASTNASVSFLLAHTFEGLDAQTQPYEFGDVSGVHHAGDPRRNIRTGLTPDVPPRLAFPGGENSPAWERMPPASVLQVGIAVDPNWNIVLLGGDGVEWATTLLYQQECAVKDW